MCFIWLNVTIQSTDFDVQRNCLLKCLLWILSHFTECGHVAYQIESTEAQKPLKWSIIPFNGARIKVNKGAKIRNRYNQVQHLTQDTNGKVTNSQLDTTNESQKVSPFPAGDHKAHMKRRAQRHSKHKTEQKHKRSTKEVPPWNSQ